MQRSLVLLKNEDVLPLAADAGLILVAGAAADDIGRQAGGWTIEWQGGSGAITEGTSILDGVRAAVARFGELPRKVFTGVEAPRHSQRRVTPTAAELRLMQQVSLGADAEPPEAPKGQLL